MSRWGPRVAIKTENVKEEEPADPVQSSNASTFFGTNSGTNSGSGGDSGTDAYEYIDEVEWGPRRDEDGYDTDQELAPRPRKRRGGQEVCGCMPPATGKACLDDSCVLYACREECSSRCECGSICGNKRLQRKEFKPVEVFDAAQKGKGLRLKATEQHAAKKGDLLCEYTGRAIREGALNRLFRRYQLDRRLYIMSLGDGIYLDARQKGGLARYINHSCRPNAKVELWNVKGVMRAAVVALSTIQPGEECTFDYQWERKRGRAPTVCHCGVPECRGTLEMPKSLEEQDLEKELQGHWEQMETGSAGAAKNSKGLYGETLVNRSVQVYSAQHKEYFLGEVTGYNAANGKHCILYRQDMKEVWENLAKEDWMVLNEKVDKDNFIIGKKAPAKNAGGAAALVCGAAASAGSAGSAGGGLVSGAPPTLHKNYLYVQTPVKQGLWNLHLIERCERNCSVQISAEQMARPPLPPIPGDPEDAEKYAALDQTLDATVWKLTITGSDVPKAYNILLKNLAFLEKKFAQERRGSMVSIASASSTARPLDAHAAPSTSDAHEAIFPRIIADAVKRGLQSVRDKCRNVTITFSASESKSKQFSKLIIEGSLLSDIEAAKEQLWTFLVALCNEAGAPMTPNKIHRNLGFLGGALSSEQFQLLQSSNNESTKKGSSATGKTRRLRLEAGEDLNGSPFIRSFESTYHCTVWVQAQEDQGRIDSKNRIVYEANPARRKIYFGCKPSEVARLAAAIQLRASELARGVKYFHLGADRVYMKLMMKGGRFFDFVKKVTGATVTVDIMTGDHLRIDGRLPATAVVELEQEGNMTEGERAALADEIVRLQVECYRDECTREQPWMFGRDWTLNSFSLVDSIGPNGSTATIGKLDKKTASQCGMEIADTVTHLELGGSVAAHAAIILYRFVHASPEFSSQVKIREAILACIFLANKAQKQIKWKRLDVVLQAGYEIFYPGAKYDKSSEEASVLEERVLAAEKEILETVQYDIFWRDTEWIWVSAGSSGKMKAHKIKMAFEFAFSGPVLSAGAELWLKYGPEYVFAAAAAFLKADLGDLLPALSLIPLKVSQAAKLLVQSAKYGKPSNKKTPSNPLLELESGKLKLESYLERIEQDCIDVMAKGNNSRATVASSAVEHRYRLVGLRSRQFYVIRGIPTDFVKSSILPILESVAAESSCRLYVGASLTPLAEDLFLDGPWRAIAIADHNLRKRLHDATALPPVVDISTSSRDRPNEQAKLCPGLLDSSSILTADGWQGTIQACRSDDPSDRRLGGKCCVPGKVGEGSLRASGLRWWIPPGHGASPSGSIADMCVMRSDRGDHLDILAALARSIALDPATVPLLSSRTKAQSEERFMPVSLQRWPPEKVESKEMAKSKSKKSKHVPVGFSAAALQEMQVLKQLHSVIPVPHGHPNFVVPVGIALPCPRDGSATTVKYEPAEERNDGGMDLTVADPVFSLFRTTVKYEPAEEGKDDGMDLTVADPVFSLFRTKEENMEAEKRKKEVIDCANIVFQPTPFVLHRFMSRKLRSSDDAMISKPILSAWFHDILSVLVHCHSNHVILRTILSDQIVVDHSGVAKLGAMYRCTVLSREDRLKPHDPLTEARRAEKKDKKESKKKGGGGDDDNDVSGNPFVSPEVLLGCPKHSQASDVWSAGCILASLLLNKPIFTGKDRQSLLTSLYKVVGTPSKKNYEEAAKFPHYCKPLKKYTRGVVRALTHLLKEQAPQHEKAIDLIARMLHLDPKMRCTAAEALGHDYMTEYSESCRSEVFRQEYVTSWIELKHRMMQISEGDRRIKAEEKTRKRTAMLMAASKSGEGDDDLYDLDDLLASSATKKIKPESD